MKKILITGANSYVGTSFEKWVAQYPESYQVDTVDTRAYSWRERDFSEYDVIFHVAGIAHVSSDPKMEDLYYKVNRDLTIEAAKKAKAEGVKQFIFMSSIIIYGDSSDTKRVITKKTEPQPSDFYGDSKLQAEQGIIPLQDTNFNVVILRPPMIYGKNSKGNYPKLSKLAKMTPLFPDIDNQRSMLHIDNLTEFIRLMIDHEESGIFFPQNEELVRTSELVKVIGNVHNSKVYLTKIFNPLLKAFREKINVINKVFGSLSYDLEISEYKVNYRVNDFQKSIIKTESKDD